MYVIDQQNASFYIDGVSINAYRAIVSDTGIILHCQATDQKAAETASAGHVFSIVIEETGILSAKITDTKITYVTPAFKDNLKPALIIELELDNTKLVLNQNLTSSFSSGIALILYPIQTMLIVPKKKADVKELVDEYYQNANPA